MVMTVHMHEALMPVDARVMPSYNEQDSSLLLLHIMWQSIHHPAVLDAG